MLSPPLEERDESVQLSLIRAVAVRGIRKGAVLDLLDIVFQAGDSDLRQVPVTLGELRLEIGENAEQIIADHCLTIGAGAGTDADGRNLQFLRDESRDLRRHGLKFQHEAA